MSSIINHDGQLNPASSLCSSDLDISTRVPLDLNSYITKQHNDLEMELDCLSDYSVDIIQIEKAPINVNAQSAPFRAIHIPSPTSDELSSSSPVHSSESETSPLPELPSYKADVTDFLQQKGIEYIGEPLGKGSFATVYRCTLPALGEVAYKALTDEAIDQETSVFSQDHTPGDALPLFFKQSSDNLVSVLGILTENPNGEIELHEKGTLRSKLEGHRLVGVFSSYIEGSHDLENTTLHSLKRVQKIGLGIINGLSSLHKTGLIHRDIKPANIILGKNDQPLLTDFGTVIPETSRLAAELAGTPYFLSPQLCMGKRASQKDDMWAAGVTLFYLKFKRFPFEGNSWFHLATNISNFTSVDDLFHENELYTLDLDFKALLGSLLNPTSQYRPNAELLKTHTFFHKTFQEEHKAA